MSKIVKIGNLDIGGGSKVLVQSMSTKRISNTALSIEEALRLEQAGCDILRFSVNDEKDALSFNELKKQQNDVIQEIEALDLDDEIEELEEI